MLRDPMITCVGVDGETTFKYYVLCDADVASEHVGWVLIVDGPSPLKPQYVTPTEIAGDLHSMGIGDEGMHYFVRVGTEDMGVDLAWSRHRDVGDTELAAVLDKHVGRQPRGVNIEARVNRMVAVTKKLEANIGIDRSAFRETRWARGGGLSPFTEGAAPVAYPVRGC